MITQSALEHLIYLINEDTWRVHSDPYKCLYFLAMKAFFADKSHEDYSYYSSESADAFLRESEEVEEGIQSFIMVHDVFNLLATGHFNQAIASLCTLDDNSDNRFHMDILSLKHLLLGNTSTARKYIIKAIEKHRKPESELIFLKLMQSLTERDTNAFIEIFKRVPDAYKQLKRPGACFDTVPDKIFCIRGLALINTALYLGLGVRIKCLVIPEDLQNYTEHRVKSLKHISFKNVPINFLERLPLILGRIKERPYNTIRKLNSIAIISYALDSNIALFESRYFDITTQSEDLIDAFIANDNGLILMIAKKAKDVIKGKGSACTDRFLYQSLKELVLGSNEKQVLWIRRFIKYEARNNKRSIESTLAYAMEAILNSDAKATKKHLSKLCQKLKPKHFISVNQLLPRYAILVANLARFNDIHVDWRDYWESGECT